MEVRERVTPRELIRLAEELRIPDKINRKISSSTREQMIAEAISLVSGDDSSNQIFSEYYRVSDFYKIGFLKPGKEAEPDYARCNHARACKCCDGTLRGTNNQNDMLPVILNLDGSKVLDFDASFTDIFDSMSSMFRKSPIALDILGSLLFRSAFVLDHSISEDEFELGKPRFRFAPSKFVLMKLESECPEVMNIPIRDFVFLLEVLALQEDVKYDTLGYEVSTKGYGRRNNLLTCAHCIAVLMGRAKLSKFAGSFARPPAGVSPMPQKEAPNFFPFLSGIVPEEYLQ
jgi:hypothetical protein